jgi:hypothetical protein
MVHQTESTGVRDLVFWRPSTPDHADVHETASMAELDNIMILIIKFTTLPLFMVRWHT